MRACNERPQYPDHGHRTPKIAAAFLCDRFGEAAPRRHDCHGGPLWADHVDAAVAFARGGKCEFAAISTKVSYAQEIIVAENLTWWVDEVHLLRHYLKKQMLRESYE